MNTRTYQPALLWAKAQAHAQRQHPGRDFRPNEIQLYIYRSDKPGAYRMHDPRLYWQPEPITGEYYLKCDPGALIDNFDTLAEVILYDKKTRTSEILGSNYQEAWRKLNA